MPELSAGAAKVEITPKSPAHLAGYASRDEPSEGVHDPLFARALMLDDGTTSICLASCDLCLLTTELHDELRELIGAATGIDPANVLLATTHTHSGPVTRGENVNAEWLEAFKYKMAYVALLAQRRKRPARIAFDSGSSDAGVNRREHKEDGTTDLGANPDGFVDRELGVFRVEDESGAPLAVAWNYGCHGTLLGPKNYLISADYMGVACHRVEQAMGDDVVAMFLSGGSGNVDPRHRVEPTPEHLEEVGRPVGEEVLRVLEDIGPGQTADLAVTSSVIEVPRREEEVADGEPPMIDVPTWAFRIGETAVATFPGELFAEIGANIKRRSMHPNTLVWSYCNGSVGYLPTADSYPEGGYEIRTTHCAPEAEAIYAEGALQLLAQVASG